MNPLNQLYSAILAIAKAMMICVAFDNLAEVPIELNLEKILQS